MSTGEKGQPYLKGRFTGLFKNANKKHNGNFVFSDIHWTHLKIEDCEKLDQFDAPSQKTGDYWYSDIIRSNKRFNPFRKQTDVFIPQGVDGFFSGDLYKVLIKNLKINHDKSYFLQKDWQEASGDIYFQVSLPPKKPKAPPSQSNSVKGSNFITNHITNTQPVVNNQTGNTNVQGNSTTGGSGVVPPTPPPPQPVAPVTQASNSNWAKWVGWFFALIIYALIAYFLWKHFRTIAYIFLVIIVLNLIGQIFKKFGFLRVLGTLAVLAFIAYYLFANYKGIMPDDMNPVKTRDGRVTVSPPKRTKNSKDGNPDYATEKEVNWFDFSDLNYLARYQTSQASFDQSVETQDELKNSIGNFSSSTEFYTRFYNGLFRMDEEKITEVAKIFSDSAANKKMDAQQTAEMVVTFIQEIPYYLVHDESCEKAISSGNEFMREYHEEGKPCLPNIAAGVQSPYEFLHNLKGDCDTRSLLGHAILSKLNIASSVWVSDTYGHSILGVAVPVGHGLYKEINGIKHYGVELTAKGYRLGMVSPEHARPNNWDITLYNNHS